MRSWFRRSDDDAPPAPAPDTDSPAALRAALTDITRHVNRNAGRLPVIAVVAARRVTDAARGLIDSLDDDDVPDVHVVVAVCGIVGDYLPTTLNRYLSLDPSVVGTPLMTGGTPADHVTEQLEALATGAEDVLSATRMSDTHDLITQGNFLRTKFTRSDLDL